jgi:hypothetical protein
MGDEFKLEINMKNTNKYREVHVCIRCIEGVCGSIIDKLKEEINQHISDSKIKD